MTKVGVLGARGRMGREVVRAVNDAPDLRGRRRGRPGGRARRADRVRRGGRLHPPRRGHGEPALVRRARPGRGGRHVGVRRGPAGRGARLAGRSPGRARPRRAELLRRRHLDDAVRRAGRPVLRLRRGDRTAPRRQGRRPVGHGAAHRVDDRRGPGRGRPGRAAGRHRVGPAGRARRRPSTTCTSTRCGWRAWWRTRRCCSAGPGRR